MDFTLSEEQQMLQDSASKFVQQEYDAVKRRKLIDTQLGYEPNHWRTFADLGWLSLPFSEANGGFGGNPVDMMVLGQVFGRGLVVEPWLAQMVLAGKLLETLANQQQLAAWLPALIQGDAIYTLAWQEAELRHNPCRVSLRAERTATGYRLNGSKTLVLNGQHADYWLVTARVSGQFGDEAGIRVFRVASQSPGVRCQGYPLVDGSRAADLELVNVDVALTDMVGGDHSAGAVVESVLDHAILASGAAAVGAMEVLYKTTVEYCKTRKQFGVPIGKFQVLQHRMVNMVIAYERALSTLYMATLKASEGGVQAKKAASALKVTLAETGRLIGQEAIQLHGGMGMTDELSVGYYFKFLTSQALMFGDREYHLARYAGLMDSE